MSVYQITYKGGAKVMLRIGSADEYRRLRGTERQRQLVADARRGDRKAKSRLLQFNYSCLPAEGGKLKGATMPSDTVGMDIDHVAAGEMERTAQRILGKKDELGLLMLERSARGEGYHLVFARRTDMTQEENLRWAARLIGAEYDKGAKDLTRVFYATTDSADDLLMLDERLFAECKEQQGVNRPEEPPKTSDSSTGNEASLDALPTYHGMAYADIVAKYWELFNDGREPEVGDRNVKTFELAVTLRSICDYRLEMLKKVVPRYDGIDEDEWETILRNALGEPRKQMPFRLRRVLEAMAEAGNHGSVALMTPPPMPERLPSLLEHLTSRVPDIYKPAVCETVWPSLAIHMHDARFRYIDNSECEPSLMNVLIAPMSSGKGCINKPIEYILAPIARRDEENRERERRYKTKKRSMGANKQKPERPDNILVQMLSSDATNAAFVQRLLDANRSGGYFLYSHVDEIELLKKITPSKSIGEVTELIRLAWDTALYGQERVGAESVDGKAPMRWNFNASTTPLNAISFLHSAVNDGTLSRLNLSTIVVPETDEMPVYGVYGTDFADKLRPYLERLDKADGLICSDEADALARRMIADMKEEAEMWCSESLKRLSFRANVIAFKKAMMLYVAEGGRWTEEIEAYVEWSAKMDLWVKMNYFGKILDSEIDREAMVQDGWKRSNVLDMLPFEFTADDVKKVYARLQRKGSPAGIIRTWRHRQKVVYDESTGVYRKIGS